VAEFDAYKQAAIPLVADARVGLEELSEALGDYAVAPAYRARAARFQADWDAEVGRIYSMRVGPPLSQGEVIGVVNGVSRPQDVVVCAAGSLPGDLHKLWRTRTPNGYHLEYGYSCMGYEIAGGLGVKLASPERDVYVLVGDGSYLMMAQELVTAVQEGIKIIVVLIDNQGHASINALSQATGVAGFGTLYRERHDGQLNGALLPVDLAANAASLGVHTTRARTQEELARALEAARSHPGPSVVVVETAMEARVGSYESWWDVPVAEVSETASAQEAYRSYTAGRARERYFTVIPQPIKVND